MLFKWLHTKFQIPLAGVLVRTTNTTTVNLPTKLSNPLFIKDRSQDVRPHVCMRPRQAGSALPDLLIPSKLDLLWEGPRYLPSRI